MRPPRRRGKIKPRSMNPTDQVQRRSARGARALFGIGACHLVHDGLSDSLYIFLPFWHAAFALSHTQVGLVVMLYFGALGAFQIPAGILAEHIGERFLLVAGTTVAGLGFLVLALADSFAGLVAILLVAGLGSTVQHPLGAALVASGTGASGCTAS